MQMLRVDAQGGFQRFEVLVVLPQRILKLESAPVELLRPLRLAFAAKDPAAHVLRFHYEDAVARQEDMIDLGGAVRRRQDDIVQAAIGLPIELQVGKKADQQFAQVPLHPG